MYWYIRFQMDKLNLDMLKEQILDCEEVRFLFRISKTTLWKWVRGGVIRQHKLGGHPVFLKDEILEDIKNNGAVLRKEHRAEA